MRAANFYLTLNFFVLLFLFAKLAFGAEELNNINAERAEALVKLEQVRVELETRIKDSEKRLELSRSLGEFIDEVSLFDNHLYGRISGESNDQRREEVLNTLNQRNSQLEKMMNDGNGGIIPPRDTEFTNEGEGDPGMTSDILELREEIASLNAELKLLDIPLDAGTAVLTADIWSGDEDLSDNIHPDYFDSEDIVDNMKNKLAEVKEMQEKLNESGN